MTEEQKPEILYIIYSKWEQANEYPLIKIHGIFNNAEIGKQFEARKKVGASCMIVPLNKFVEKGVEL